VGVEPDWIIYFEQVLSANGIGVKSVPHNKLHLLQIAESNLVVNCLSVSNTHTIEYVLEAQHNFQLKGIQLVNLWEDVWCNRPTQVLNRIQSLAGRNHRIHGRKTTVITLNKEQADHFLSAFHIQGPAMARFKLGLIHENELVAVATFSGTRLMRQHTEGYRSAELIRFATKAGYTVTGGLTKLIKHFTTLVNTNDIMTYADRDWSTGKGYESVGFTFHSLIPLASIWLDTFTNKRHFQHRLPQALLNGQMEEAILENKRFVRTFHTGSLKYILYL